MMQDGSPAHAGIDPRGACPTCAAAGFPRTRGDRPLLFKIGAGLYEVPPHTRG